MARVPHRQREQLTSEHQHHYDAIASTRGYVGPNFAVLFNSPEATGRFAAFGEYVRYHVAVPPRLKELARPLLDSRVVDLSRWSTPTFATLSSLSPLFFNGIRNVLRCAKSVKAEDPGLQ